MKIPNQSMPEPTDSVATTPNPTNKITLLPEDIINKIAAGEVIERPASVIKELVENSIDAGATSIEVHIKDAGQTLIKVKDNGSGMTKEDAKISILRHATSKIKTTNDLYSIQSLGFRGEALASIAAVSKLTITTKTKLEQEATRIIIHAGNIIRETIAAQTTGTTIEVENLFFNTPARKKFLKSNPIETKHIINFITNYALLNNNITFKLIVDDKTTILSPSTNDQRANIASIYTKELAKDLLEVNNIQAQTQNITIQGYIGKPLSAKSDKSYQSLFVNNRYVKSKLINDAIYEAYHSTLFTTRHPIYVLKISVDPKSIDVNVHPNKMDIKFEQKDIVYKAVNQAIKDTLESNSLIPTDTFKSEQMHFAAPRKDTRILLEQPKYAFEASKQTVFQEKSSTNSINSPKINSSPQEIISNYEQGIQNISQNIVKESSAIYSNTPESNIPESSTQSYNDSIHTHSQINQAATSIASPTAPPTVLETSTENLIQGSHKFPEMKILGQIHKTFFVAETKGGMLLIDQHVVEERVLYEEFMNEYLNKHIQTQTLLKPDILTFTPKQTIIIQNNLEKLKDFGFHLSHFGENDFSLTTTPTILGRTQNKELLEQIIAQLDNFTRQSQKPMHFLQEEIITRMACRASVKAGDTMTIPQITKLLKKLTGCTLPYTCPHGRAIVIKITAEELEKKFLRHG